MKEYINVLNPPLYYECNQKTWDYVTTIIPKVMDKVAGNFSGIDIRVVEGKPDGLHPVYSYTEK